MIRGIHHVGVNTANSDRLLAFYVDVIGFKVVRDYRFEGDGGGVIGLGKTAGREIILRAGDADFQIFEFTEPAARNSEPLRACDHGYTHLCLDVVDIDSEYARLVAAGMRFNSPPQSYGAISACYGYDPDGNLIEIMEGRRPLESTPGS